MRFILGILLTAVAGYLAGLVLPWWSIALVAFLVALLLRPRPGAAFLSGFLGIFILWGVVALWIDLANQGILSHKMARLFPLGGSAVLLILVTAFVGAIVGGFAALSGSLLLPRRAYVR